MTESKALQHQKSFYDERWKSANYINKLKLQRCIAILDSLRRLPVTQPKIIDLGCGTGWLTAMLGNIGPTTGVDLSDVTIRTASQKYPTIRFLQADIQSWTEFETNTYDVVVSQEVVEHLESQASHFQLAYDLLKPNCFLILTTPNARTYQAIAPEQQKQWGPQPVENLLTNRQLRQLAEPYFHGIRIRSIIPEFGSQGIYRLFSSVRLKKTLKMFGLLEAMHVLRLRMGFGLHWLFEASRKS